MNRQPGVENAVTANSLLKKFGSLPAVDRFSISIRRGEILTLLGPNGAGKTTLLRILAGLHGIDGGSYSLFGQTGEDLERFQRHSLGYAPQSPALWGELTALEQLVFMGELYGLSRREGRSRARDLLRELGLESVSDRRAGRLSGGMRSRLNLLLSLMNNPTLLLLDEPQAGLDWQSRILMRDFLRRLSAREERTIVLSTHDLNEADLLSDRVAVIDHGQLVALDTPEGLKKRVGNQRGSPPPLEEVIMTLTEPHPS